MNDDLIKLQDRLKELDQERSEISLQITKIQNAQHQNCSNEFIGIPAFVIRYLVLTNNNLFAVT